MSEFRKILKDLNERRFIESYLVLLLALSLLIADIFELIDPSILNKMILAVLSALLYVKILERREFKESTLSKEIEDISIFHSSRKNMISFSELINKAKKELIFYSIQHDTLVKNFLGQIEKKAEDGCKIKILIMSPLTENGSINPNVSEIAKHRLYSGLLQKLESNITTLKDWMARLDSSIYNRIEIRTYQEFPVATYTFIDRETMDGFVQVEVCLYGIQVFDMPSYIVTKKNGGNFYDMHYKSFEKLWTNAKDIIKSDN
ncbi:MAG: DUF5919 domain-containing protein [Candidatus Hodarchaeota archaeon]